MTGMLEIHLVGRRLSAFVDGELLPHDACRWREHLLDCSTCTRAVAAERNVRERVRHSCVPLPTPEFMLRVAAMAGESAAATSGAAPPRRSRRAAVGIFVVTTTTAVAVVGLVGVGTLSVQGTPASPTATPAAEASGGAVSSPVFVRAGFGTMLTYSLTPYGETTTTGR